VSHLLRDIAPVQDAGWAALEEEARTRLGTLLAARRVVDFSGPKGWTHSATDLRSTKEVPHPDPQVQVRQRRVLPLVELRVPFDVARRELEDAERGARNIDLSGLETATMTMALAENRLVFHGLDEAGIVGIETACGNATLKLPATPDGWPAAVAEAVNVLKLRGIDGPYALVIGPEGYTRIAEASEQGVVLTTHLRRILDGPVVWAPGVEGAFVLTIRGGDFELECGQDISIGYLDHDGQQVHLYLEESLSFRVLEPQAAVLLR